MPAVFLVGSHVRLREPRPSLWAMFMHPSSYSILYPQALPCWHTSTSDICPPSHDRAFISNMTPPHNISPRLVHISLSALHLGSTRDWRIIWHSRGRDPLQSIRPTRSHSSSEERLLPAPRDASFSRRASADPGSMQATSPAPCQLWPAPPRRSTWSPASEHPPTWIRSDR